MAPHETLPGLGHDSLEAPTSEFCKEAIPHKIIKGCFELGVIPSGTRFCLDKRKGTRSPHRN